MRPCNKNVNFNVGVVGHIDSGKTSLSRALSTTASTASFDKCPESQERGITVDLGFSSFEIQSTDDESTMTSRTLQFTLVDCPGHASLIRTVIGGSQIIDIMLLVIDVTKGMQTQTAECLVLGEITTSKMIVVLNKIDLLDDQKRATLIEKVHKKMQKTMERTKFAGCPIVSVAAKPGGLTEVDSPAEPVGLDALISALRDAADFPRRDPDGPFVFAVDHCFSIRGQGTVMTGTVLSGTVAVGNNIEVASIKEVRKVKSIQMFRKPVESACQGDRAGICVTQFDAKLLERGLVCSPGVIATTYAAIASVRPIRFFKGHIRTKAKFHVSLGHSTVMANCHFFESNDDDGDGFDWNKDYAHCDELLHVESPSSSSSRNYFALLQFERPVTVPPSSLVIGSRLDADIHVNTCRLAFEGRFVHGIENKDYAQILLPRLRVFKVKSKEGIVERMVDAQSVIVRSIFKKDSNTQHFTGMRVGLSSGETGFIESNFGQSGKIKIRVPEGLKDQTIITLNALVKKRNKKSLSTDLVDDVVIEPVKISLTFKRYVFDPKKNVVQS